MMTGMKFKSGDIVRQIENFQLMIVEVFDDLKNAYYCQWMEGDQFKDGYYPCGIFDSFLRNEPLKNGKTVGFCQLVSGFTPACPSDPSNF